MTFHPDGLHHHPHSPKAIRQKMRAVLPDIVAAVQGRVSALVFSELTGMTGTRGFGPADIIRSFLEPKRKHVPHRCTNQWLKSSSLPTS